MEIRFKRAAGGVIAAAEAMVNGLMRAAERESK